MINLTYHDDGKCKFQSHEISITEDNYGISNNIFVVYGHIYECGDTDTWIEELFDNEEQAKACCEFLNLTKSQKNVEYSTGEINGLCKEDYISKLKYLQK